MTHHAQHRRRPPGRPPTTGLRFSELIRQMRPELCKAFGIKLPDRTSEPVVVQSVQAPAQPTLFDTAAVNSTAGDTAKTGRPHIANVDSANDAKTARSKGAVSTRNPAAGGAS